MKYDKLSVLYDNTQPSWPRRERIVVGILGLVAAGLWIWVTTEKMGV